jgi:hypothetical protein
MLTNLPRQRHRFHVGGVPVRVRRFWSSRTGVDPAWRPASLPSVISSLDPSDRMVLPRSRTPSQLRSIPSHLSTALSFRLHSVYRGAISLTPCFTALQTSHQITFHLLSRFESSGCRPVDKPDVGRLQLLIVISLPLT